MAEPRRPNVIPGLEEALARVDEYIRTLPHVDAPPRQRRIMQATAEAVRALIAKPLNEARLRPRRSQGGSGASHESL